MYASPFKTALSQKTSALDTSSNITAKKSEVKSSMESLVRVQFERLKDEPIFQAILASGAKQEDCFNILAELHMREVDVQREFFLDPYCVNYLNGRLMDAETAKLFGELYVELKRANFQSNDEYFDYMNPKINIISDYYFSGSRLAKLTIVELILSEMRKKKVGAGEEQPFSFYFEKQWSFAMYIINSNFANILVNGKYVPGLSARGRRYLFERCAGRGLSNLIARYDEATHITSWICDNLCIGFRDQSFRNNHKTTTTSIFELKRFGATLGPAGVLCPNLKSAPAVKEDFLKIKERDAAKKRSTTFEGKSILYFEEYFSGRPMQSPGMEGEAGAQFLLNFLSYGTHNTTRLSIRKHLHKELHPMGCVEGNPDNLRTATKFLINIASLTTFLEEKSEKLIVLNGDSSTFRSLHFLVRQILAAVESKQYGFNNEVKVPDVSNETMTRIVEENGLNRRMSQANYEAKKEEIIQEHETKINALNPTTRAGRKSVPTEVTLMFFKVKAAEDEKTNKLEALSKAFINQVRSTKLSRFNFVSEQIFDLCSVFGLDLDVGFTKLNRKRQEEILTLVFFGIVEELANFIETKSEPVESAKRSFLYLDSMEEGKRTQVYFSNLDMPTMTSLLELFCVQGVSSLTNERIKKLTKHVLIAFRERALSYSSWNVAPKHLYQILRRMLVCPDFFHVNMGYLFQLASGREGQPKVRNKMGKDGFVGPLFILLQPLVAISPGQLGLYKGFDKLFVLTALVLIAWRNVRELILKDFAEQIRNGYKTIVEAFKNREKTEEEKNDADDDKRDDFTEQKKREKEENALAALEAEMNESVLLAREKNLEFEDDNDADSNAPTPAVSDDNNENGGSGVTDGEENDGSGESEGLSPKDVNAFHSYDPELFASDDENLASFVYVMEHIVPHAVGFLPRLESAKGEDRLFVLYDMLECLKSANCTVYYKTLMSFIADLLHLKLHHQDTYREFMEFLPQYGSITIEHLHGWLDRVTKASAREVTDLNRILLVYEELRNGIDFVASPRRSSGMKVEKDEFGDGRSSTNNSSWNVYFNTSKLDDEKSFGGRFIRELQRGFEWMRSNKMFPKTTSKYVSATLEEHELILPDDEFKSVHDFAFGDFPPESTPSEWNILNTDQHGKLYYSRGKGKMEKPKDPIQMFEDFETMRITPPEVATHGTDFTIFNKKKT